MSHKNKRGNPLANSIQLSNCSPCKRENAASEREGHKQTKTLGTDAVASRATTAMSKRKSKQTRATSMAKIEKQIERVYNHEYSIK